MNDNEKLIEEAAKAMFLRQNPRSSWEMLPSNDMHRVDWMTDARTAFAVFDKAHTPTDDEREALAQLVWSRFRMEPWPDAEIRRSAWLNVADTILTAGFRRSEGVR